MDVPDGWVEPDCLILQLWNMVTLYPPLENALLAAIQRVIELSSSEALPLM